MIPEGWCNRTAADLYVDLGTVNTLVATPAAGVVVDEPSVVAFTDRGDGAAVLAVGSRAQDMLGRTPGRVTAVRPLRDGVIADIDAATLLLAELVGRCHRRWLGPRPRLVVSLPAAVTPVEREAVREAGLRAGARRVTLIEEPMAAALGATMPVLEPRASMVVDVGGGTTEVALISLGALVACRAARIGGDHMDEAIVRVVRQRHQLVVGERSAEAAKIAVASAFADGPARSVRIAGRDLASGCPRTAEITAAEVHAAIEPILARIVELVRSALAAAPPEMAVDVSDSGMLLTGGGALVRDLDRRLALGAGVPVRLAPQPLATVALGGHRALTSAAVLRRIAVG